MTPAAATSSGQAAPGPSYGSVLALGKPDDSVLTVIIVGLVVLLLVFFLLRHMIRKRGGWRRFRRRVGRELTLTRRAFGEPPRAYRRHRRGVRALARQLSDPRGGLLVRRLLDAASAALADAPGAVAYAVRTEAGLAAVQIAARHLPEPPAPWEASEGPGPQRWELPLGEGDELPQGRTRAGARLRPLPVAVGMADHACVHLDLTAGPRLITVEGDAAARTRLLQALAAQLDRPASGASVVVTDGVHPQYRGERFDAMLRELEAAPAGTGWGEEAPGEIGEPARAATTVVVCATPTPEQARRLSALTVSGAVVCLVDGRVAGHSWALRVDARGRVISPELGLDADSAPLGRAVAAAVRADRRRLRRGAGPRRGIPAARRTGTGERRPGGPDDPRRPGETERTEEARRLRDTGLRLDQTRSLEEQETVSPEETVTLQETSTEPGLRTTAPTRTTTASDLLAEPATARDRPTAASSGVREE